VGAVSEYILRNEAYQELHEARVCDATDKWGRGYNAGITEAMDIINNIIPPADVAPVVHGRWEVVYNSVGKQEGQCTHCGKNSGILITKKSYGPHCGEKMDGGET
jgi:hypothetical protein